jgi:Integrase core domain
MRSPPTSDSGSRASDGGASGFFAVGLIYGQVKKTKWRRRLMGVTYVLRCGTRVALRAALMGLGLSGKLNTACIERVNLTLRQSVAALARRTWSTLQDAPQLLLQLEWWRAYYQFVRPHVSLGEALAQPLDRGGKRQPQREKAAHTGHGGGAEEEALSGPRTPRDPTPIGAARYWLRRGKRGRQPPQQPDRGHGGWHGRHGDSHGHRIV